MYIPCTLRGKGLGESGGPSLKGKGGLVGFRKTLKVQGSTGGFSKVQEITFIFSNVKKAFFKPYFLKKIAYFLIINRKKIKSYT